MINNISQIDIEKCFGCSSCMDVCFKKAISMEFVNGFRVPIIDNINCVNCGACLSNCTKIHNIEKKESILSIICYSNLDEYYKNASSGGFFGTAAYKMIDMMNGVVFGATIDGECNVFHKKIEDIKDIKVLQGSKYVQSNIENIWPEIKYYNSINKKVLFCGTPCQIAAIRSKYDCENIIFLDLVCHGVPSPELFKEHVFSKYIKSKKVSSIYFRTKDKYDKYGFNLMIETNKKRRLVSGMLDEYYRLFLEGASYRLSCYSCPFACGKRVGDITIGDCGNSKKYNLFSNGKTISTIYINTQKGLNFWNLIKDNFTYMMANVEEERKVNKQMNFPTPKPEIRKEMYPCDESKLKYIYKKNYSKGKLKLSIKFRLKRIIPENKRIKIIKLIKGR